MTSRLALVSFALSLAACQDPPAAPAAVPGATPAAAPGATPGAVPAPSALATPTVPASTLQALLPSQVGDLPRTAVVAEQDSAMGLTITRAEGTYGTGPQAVTLLVLDVGSAEGAALMGLAAPPTGQLAGRPVRRSETPTEASVLLSVGGRYFVEAAGSRVGLDLLDVFVQTVDLSALPGGG